VGVDVFGRIWHRVFCPHRHAQPYGTGFFDRLAIGILGDRQSVFAYGEQWKRHLVSKPNARLFRRPARNLRENGGQLSIADGMLLHTYPNSSYFPLATWIFGLWENSGVPAGAWGMSRHIDGLLMIVDPQSFSGDNNARGPGAKGLSNPGDLLDKFWKSTGSPLGRKLPVSLAIVLDGCDSLIRNGDLPANMPWNLPSLAAGHHNPLVQCDTSARLGEFVARNAPKLYKVARNYFANVAFFGTGNLSGSSGNGTVHRSQDPLTWMLAERKQVSVLKTSKALKQLSSKQGGDYVF